MNVKVVVIHISITGHICGPRQDPKVPFSLQLVDSTFLEDNVHYEIQISGKG